MLPKTKNSWLGTNLMERVKDPFLDFSVSINPYGFNKMSFDAATEFNIKEISNDYSNFYLALSGGYDSEFILRAFDKFGIPIKPIIVMYGNEVESVRAFKACSELKIDPIVIELTDEQYANCFVEKIYKRYNGVGYHCVHTIICAEYVLERSGTLITGNHLIGDGDTIIRDEYASSNEWDFYIDYLYPELNKLDFFLYTLEIVYSMLPKDLEETWGSFKQKTFGLEHRIKAAPKYPKNIVEIIRNLLTDPGRPKPNFQYVLTKEKVDKILNDHIINYV